MKYSKEGMGEKFEIVQVKTKEDPNIGRNIPVLMEKRV